MFFILFYAYAQHIYYKIFSLSTCISRLSNLFSHTIKHGYFQAKYVMHLTEGETAYIIVTKSQVPDNNYNRFLCLQFLKSLK